jgi:hypothetical protein
MCAKTSARVSERSVVRRLVARSKNELLDHETLNGFSSSDD